MNFSYAAFRWYMHPTPVRYALNRIVDMCGLLPYETRVNLGAVKRPHYAYCLLRAAKLAERLGYPRISAIEFGVAGGQGLLNLEYHAARVERATRVKIEIYGFDSGHGLPAPMDYRDLPYHWRAGFFAMDRKQLLQTLKRSTLLVGSVRETIGEFVSKYDPAPVACIFHDLDYYSSTASSFDIFAISETHRCPRIYNYFDDVIGDEIEMYNEYTGELLAIREYNEIDSHKKICRARNFYKFAHQQWHLQIFIHHDFTHRDYTKFISHEDQQLPL